MEMLLRHVTIPELADLFRKHQNQSPAPYLKDPEGMDRAKRLAKINGIWDEIDQNLDPSCEIPVIKRSSYRNFQRIGDRTLPQAKAGDRQRELQRAVLALWLDHPKADIDYLQDLLWAYCDDYTWVMAAHEGRAIDLGSASLGATFAEILHLLGDRLEQEIKERLTAEIERRIFQNFWNYKIPDFWKTIRHNWNHVCNGEIIRTALFLIEDPLVLAHMIHAAIQNLTYAIDGFTNDGGCEEGPGYWGYGFGHFVDVSYSLYLKTGGELNLMADEKIERICRYPLAAHIDGPIRSTFADSGHGYIPVKTALLINQFYQLPELYELCSLHADRSLKLSSMHEIALYQGQTVTRLPDTKDYLLPDLGQVKLRGKPGKQQITLMVLAGHNNVNHNHNDIGSFIVYRFGTQYLVDPGAPLYTKKTFSASRYEIVFCNSIGHSVPVVNGKLQEAGANYYGTLSVENLNGEGLKSALIDMTHAYPTGTVEKLIRTFTLDSNRNELTLEDDYTFASDPLSVEEAFITFEEVIIMPDGRTVCIGSGDEKMILSSVNQSGTFAVKRLVEESKEGQTKQVINRITFMPDTLINNMKLTFILR